MVGKATQSQQQSGMIRNWLLAILRFAVTREDVDRMCVLDAARELDRQGPGDGNPSFSFFVRTSAEICTVIVSDDVTARQAVLTCHFNAIDDQRLRDATEHRPARSISSKTIRRPRDYLWKGLPSR
jgi:hypothetical protein